MTTPTPIPILHYFVGTWTSGQTRITNEGSLGTSSVMLNYGQQVQGVVQVLYHHLYSRFTVSQSCR